MEGMGMIKEFWKNRKVFITGHTGFKGGWIALLLHHLGAKVYGYSRNPSTRPNFYDIANLESIFEKSFIGEINDFNYLSAVLNQSNPSLIFHMAAQPLVRDSYVNPIETFNTNVMGTVNILEAARSQENIKAIVNITSDKCYENKEWIWPYREEDVLGGRDPYSSSKACAELVAKSYKLSFLEKENIGIASVRAGNVIGGGDWSKDRLIPDFFRALNNGEVLNIRSPNAIRPWQHVLEPISGYIMLAEKLILDNKKYSGAWNFGPYQKDTRSVSSVIDFLVSKKNNSKYSFNKKENLYEAKTLKLDSTKARENLGWEPKWTLEEALSNTLEWNEAFLRKENMKDFSIRQIDSFINK